MGTNKWTYGFGTAAPTSARVKIIAQNNATLQDAFQFDPAPDAPTGVTGGTGPWWNFEGKKFRLDIKGNNEQDNPLLTLMSDDGEIVVDSTTLRILHLNVDDDVLRAALVPGKYYYDFIMYDTSTPPVRVPLMHGEFILTDGVTGE